MLHLMNSAMMPTPGKYSLKKIAKEEFVAEFIEDCVEGNLPWKSSIGYPQLSALLSELLGTDVPLSRDQTQLSDDDIVLVAKLPYRVNPTEKGERQHGSKIEDYEFFLMKFSV